MPEYLKRVLAQLYEFFRGLPANRKAAALTTLGVIVAAVTAMLIWAGDQSFQPLFTQLNQEDSTNIIRILREKRIPFRVDEAGKSIAIPPERVYDLRLEIASLGFPQTSVVGYEVFDKQNLGTPSFIQKLNQKRALEGELMRTIGSIRGVRRSRVHLALPSKSPFIEDQKKASASVFLDLEPGFNLSEKQTSGIQNLIAKAVDGLDTVDVTVVDSSGKVLSKNTSDPLALASATQLEFKSRLENDLESRIEAMLSRVVGDGKVVARVSADLDFTSGNEIQTTYDPDGAAIRSAERNNETMDSSRPAPIGAAGATTNSPDRPAPGVGTKTDTKKADELIQYNVPSTVKNIQKPMGAIKKISVAVMVDGKRVTSTVGADGKPLPEGKSVVQYEAWSEDRLKEFESIVASAAGIDKKRGDILEIKNVEFVQEDFDAATKILREHERRAFTRNLMIYGVIGITIILFFLLAVRPFIKWLTENTVDSVDTFLPQTVEELEKIQRGGLMALMEDALPQLPESVDPEKMEGEMIKEKIMTMIDANPHKAALVLKDWVHAVPPSTEEEEAKKKEAG